MTELGLQWVYVGSTCCQVQPLSWLLWTHAQSTEHALQFLPNTVVSSFWVWKMIFVHDNWHMAGVITISQDVCQLMPGMYMVLMRKPNLTLQGGLSQANKPPEPLEGMPGLRALSVGGCLSKSLTSDCHTNLWYSTLPTHVYYTMHVDYYCT